MTTSTNTCPTRRWNRKRWGLRGSKFWISVGALTAHSIIGYRMPALAQQQGSVRGGQQAQSLVVRQFSIPAGDLGTVLAAFTNATGLRITVPNEALRTLPSPGVSGLLTATVALDKILAGTGVIHKSNSDGSITLELKGVSTTVEVADRAPQVQSARYTEPLRDTPQTIMVIPKAVMEQQGATTLRDVLRNVPGLTIAAGEGGVPAGDNVTLRGFSARNDMFIDGARDLSPQSRDPFNMEQVEVTKGPTSAFYGRGSAGGTINMVSKAPNLNRYFGGSVSLGNASMKRVTADVNTPVKFLGERTAFRLNFLAHDSGVAGRNVVENSRWGVAPSLAFGLGTPTRLTLSYYKLKQDNIPDYGIPWVPNTNNVLAAYRDKPAPVPRETFYGIPSRDTERMGSDLATVRFEHDFSDNLNLRNQLRYGRSTRNSITAAPRFASNDSTVINRNGPSWITEDNVWDNQTDVRARFSTGSLQHAFAGGANFTSENNIRKGRTIPAAPATTLYNPDPTAPYTGVIAPTAFVGDITGNTQAVYGFDTVELGKHWQATGGLRWERFDVNGVNTTPAPVVQTVTMHSLRGGVVYKPVDKGSVYASYGSSLSPSLEGLSYSTFNSSIQPEKTYTIELGTKWDVADDRLMLSGAIFRVDKDNARTPGLLPDEPPQVLQGTQRVKGIELGATGGITRSLKIFAAYTLLDGKIIKSNTPAELGRTFQNTPRNSASIWTTYAYKKFLLGGGPRFVGRRFGNNINTRQVDKYWTMDLLASYPVTSKLDLRLNLYNLNNAFYFDRLGGGHLIPGAARSVMVSTSFSF